MQNSLSTRSWNGTPIHRRTTDGFVNATAMCKANGKEWNEYRRSSRCCDYLGALSQCREISGNGTDELIQARPRTGTWVHPQIAVDLARWISAPFAVWMDGWFLEALEAQQAVQTAPAMQQLPAAVEIKAAVECVLFIHDALEARNLVDDRNRLELKRNLITLQTAAVFSSTGTLPGTTEVLSPAENLPLFFGKSVDPEIPLTVVEFATAYLDKKLSAMIQKQCTRVGRVTHQMYQDRHNEEAPQTTHLSVKADEGRKRQGLFQFSQANTGFACSPRVYFPRDWDLIIQAAWRLDLMAADTSAELMAECRQFHPA